MEGASAVRLVVLAAIWGASFLFMRVGAPVFGPAALIELRVAVAALFLWLVARWLRRGPHGGSMPPRSGVPAGGGPRRGAARGRGLALRAHWRHYLVMGLINSALPFLLFAYAAQTLSASLLSILNSTAPIFGAVVAALWLRTPVSRPAMAGLALGLMGVVLLVGGGVSMAGRGVPAALAAALVAPLCYALASTYAKATSAALEPFDNAHGSMWAAALLVLPLMPLAPIRHMPAAGDWLAVALLGVVCTGAAYLMYFRLIRDVGPVRALSVTFLIPVFGVLWGALFLGEPVGWSLLLGGVLVLLGTALTNGVPVWPALRRVAARVRGVA